MGHVAPSRNARLGRHSALARGLIEAIVGPNSSDGGKAIQKLEAARPGLLLSPKRGHMPRPALQPFDAQDSSGQESSVRYS